ncbi:hypothetical protein LshimejAT787_1900220 [Lyophyllum shimeji]|uniref:Uncharacterized protein n=1 Tax=Lyophyllum shimeji TaxID=47721 RepID=A0A9P3Q0H8_LYOSH|nr:hypothetical protein LshimejAT787_1900220 [Lyophyllum shimeji]
MVVDILILGAGWTSAFLIPLLSSRSASPRLTYSATSRTGSPARLPFFFDPDLDDVDPFENLPDARTVLITFPILTPQTAERLVGLHGRSRKGGDKDKDFKTGFILLGTSGIWAGPRIPCPSQAGTREPKPHPKPAHANLARPPHAPTRAPPRPRRDRPPRALHPPNAQHRAEPRRLYLLHGHDLARAILAVHAGRFVKAEGQRWLLTDGRVYDWWDLAAARRPSLDAGETAPGPPRPRPCYARWVRELMREQGVRALPRGLGELGRVLDLREFWEVFGLSPVRALLARE